jgi:uncharacterized membrane protein YedE/YeeE
MLYALSSLLTGLIFGFGLILSGMANPEKVLGFLDLAGNWDPSLALVMGGAVAVGLVAFRFARKRTKSILGLDMKLPSGQQLDKRLIIGALVFGAGWGLAGFCPGPGLVAMGAGELKALIFVVAMVAGMGLFEVIEQARTLKKSAESV